jgi:hypothetical protein
MRREDWRVGAHGVRPAGRPDACFYCGSAVGDQHRQDCVIRSQTVVVRFSFDLVVDVPETWDRDNIEFKYNESSYCCDNLIEELEKTSTRVGCLCNLVEAEFIREANASDEAEQKVFVSELPS